MLLIDYSMSMLFVDKPLLLNDRLFNIDATQARSIGRKVLQRVKLHINAK